MAEIRIPYTLATPFATVVLNQAFALAVSGTSVMFRLDDIPGLDQAPIRSVVEDAPQTDGGIVYPSKKGPRHVTPTGVIRVVDVVGETAAITARNEAEDLLIDALESIENADGTLSFTRTGGAARALTVRCDMPVVYSSGGGPLKRFAFGLVAANPAFS